VRVWLGGNKLHRTPPHNRMALTSRLNIYAIVRPAIVRRRFRRSEWEPIPLSDPSDIELVRGGFMELGAGTAVGCCPP
jgi:hypothetical protein